MHIYTNLNWPDGISAVNRLFLESLRFSLNFLSSPYKKNHNIVKEVPQVAKAFILLSEKHGAREGERWSSLKGGV